MRPIASFVTGLRELGIRLWVEPEGLRYKGPKHALTVELVAEMKQCKDEILSFLRQVQSSTGQGLPPITSAPRGGRLPSSFAQQRLWFLYKLDGASPAYNILMACRLEGPLDREALERAFAFLVERHESLRTVFREEQGIAYQVVQSETTSDFVFVDMQHLSAADQEARLAHIKAEAARRTFRLEQGPLAASTLIRLAQQDHVLLMVMHHIIGDGWSLGIMWREVALFYDAFASGQRPRLDVPELQYPDFAWWQRKWVSGDFLDKQLVQWREILRGAPPLLDLCPGRPRSAVKSSEGDTQPVLIPRALAQQLKALSHDTGTSLFMTLLAVFKILLHRYCGHDDVLVGTQVANRERRELESLIGFFVNTLVLRTNLGGAPTFRELLERVRQVTLTAFSLQMTPFEKLVESLQPERNFSYNPLVQVMFLWQNAPLGTLQLRNLKITPVPMKSAASKFDLTLELSETQNGIEGVLQYSKDLFTADMLRRMADHFVCILQSAVETPDRSIASFPLMPQARWSRTLAGLNQSANEPLTAEWQRHETLHAAFAAQVRKTPGAVAVVDHSQQLTYAELNGRANRWAHHLRAAGVGPERLVGICMSRGVEFIVAILATLKAGGAYLPLDISYPKDRIRRILQDAKPVLVVAHHQWLDLLPADRVRTICLDRDAESIARLSDSDPPNDVHPANLAYVIFTSGSTGRPKGVMIEHRAVLNLVAAMAATVYAKYREPTRVGLMAAFVFDASVQQIFASLLQGHALPIADEETRRDGGKLRQFFKERAIEVADGTPSLLSIMIGAEMPCDPELVLKDLIVGGEALPAALIADFYRAEGSRRIKITNVYGPTECCVDVSCWDVPPNLPAAQTVAPIGKPLLNTQMYVLDGHRNPQPADVLGKIHIAGAGLGRGYLGDPAQTAAKFIPNPFEPQSRMYATGDLGRWNASGEIEFLGRDDDQVKVRGFRVELGEIEAQLRAIPAVRQAAVTTKTGPSGYRELIAYLAGATGLTVEDIRTQLATSLPGYMIPSRFVILEALPVNVNGKVDRAALPDPAVAEVAPQGVEHVTPRDECERCLVEVWRGVLTLDRVGVLDNFFSLGGDSIKALQVVARLREMGWKLLVRDIFTHPTVAELAPHVDPLIDRPKVSRPALGPVPLTGIQQRFFREHQGAFEHFNQALLLVAKQPLQEAILRQALEAVAQHHESLRLRFHSADEKWVQQYATDGDIVAFQCVDLLDRPASSLTDHARRVQNSFDLQRGPLLKCILYRQRSGDRLLLVAHHLVVDGVSWRVLLEDLLRAYQQVLAGQPLRLPAKSDCFQVWSEHIQRFAQADVLDEVEYWKGIDQTPVAPLPADRPLATTRYRDVATLTLSFSQTDTLNLLLEANRAYGTEINDILVTALARAVGRWSGTWRTALMLEGHGREALFETVDVSRTVGWFTSVYPVVVELPDNDDLGHHIKLVKETLRKIPRKGAGYAVLRYITEPHLRRGLEFRLAPQLSFNFLGQFGDPSSAEIFARAFEDMGPTIDPEAKPPYEIELVGMIVDNQIEFELFFSTALFQENNVRRLRDVFEQELREVLEHTRHKDDTELTPSDIDYDGFDIQQLEQFINQM